MKTAEELPYAVVFLRAERDAARAALEQVGLLIDAWITMGMSAIADHPEKALTRIKRAAESGLGETPDA